MFVRRTAAFSIVCGVLMFVSVWGQSTETIDEEMLTPIEELGKLLFYDSNLSVPKGMSCSTCHGPAVGFTGDDESVNMGGAVYPGAVPTRFGNRKPPAAAYAGESPILAYDDIEGHWVGGMFWDGRATGWTLEDPLAEQAQGPFLNPLEHNLPNAYLLCIKIKHSEYSLLFKQVWQLDAINCIWNRDQVYEQIGRSLAAYERSEEVSPFNSRYDAYLNGEPALSAQELSGLELFEGKANCAACHPNTLGPAGELPSFTDFTYDNLGLPRNEENPFYSMPCRWNPEGNDWVDQGLGGFLASAGFDSETYEPEIGKHKVPTLRNVDLRPTSDFVKAYGHNGFFKSLEELVHFYNTRDVDGAGWLEEPWPAPEVPETMNTSEMGDLGLSEDEEAAVVAFLKALSDNVI